MNDTAHMKLMRSRSIALPEALKKRGVGFGRRSRSEHPVVRRCCWRCAVRATSAPSLCPTRLISGVSNNHRRICFINYAVNPRHYWNPLLSLGRCGTSPLSDTSAMHTQKQVITVLLHANCPGGTVGISSFIGKHLQASCTSGRLPLESPQRCNVLFRET
jgi:hypothetical protein